MCRFFRTALNSKLKVSEKVRTFYGSLSFVEGRIMS